MARALELAERGRGLTAPNPCVGAVLVRDGLIVAEGWHTRHGAHHAEVEALRDARDKGVDPAECAMYVTLEPCNHQGKTPACTEAVLGAGVASVFVGARDPNRSVAGGGVERLRAEGVTVSTGVLERECLDAIADFRVWQTTRRPYVILKMAQTLDGRIAGRAGNPEAVSGPASKDAVQRLRGRIDAVLVGGGTFLADDPRLTCRTAEHHIREEQPYAVIATRRLPEPTEKRCLLRDRPERTVFLTTVDAASSSVAEGLRNLGCTVLGLRELPAGLDLAEGLAALRSKLSCHTVLCEGGGRLAGSLVAQALADEIRLFVSPRILADEHAPAAFAGQQREAMAQADGFRIARLLRSGEDLFIELRPKDD
jgi:diaminohydroxyphosphoribosylaminopyrimidine deaminase/5-amino-6-(5-phosphoribosylamino)uracil reductase